MEQQFTAVKEALFATLTKFGTQFLEGIGNLIIVAILLFIGWIIAKIARFITHKILHTAQFDAMAAKVNIEELLQQASISTKPSQILANLVYWVILFFFFVAGTEILGWQVVSEQLTKLINLLPNLFSGIILFFIGYYIASFIRDLISAATGSLGIGAGKLIAGFVFYFLLILVSITALNQIGIDTTIITSNIVLILGTILISGALSYGFASKDILANMLAAFFSRKTFEVGQRIRLDDIEGVIVDIDNIYLTIQTAQDKVVIPTKELVNNRIHIIE